MHQFWVVRGPREELILGMDFIHCHGLQYHSTRQHFSWKDKPVQNLDGLPDRPKLLSLPELRGTNPSTPGLPARVLSHLPHVSSLVPNTNQDLPGPLFLQTLFRATSSSAPMTSPLIMALKFHQSPPPSARPTSPNLPMARTPTGHWSKPSEPPGPPYWPRAT